MSNFWERKEQLEVGFSIIRQDLADFKHKHKQRLLNPHLGAVGMRGEQLWRFHSTDGLEGTSRTPLPVGVSDKWDDIAFTGGASGFTFTLSQHNNRDVFPLTFLLDEFQDISKGEHEATFMAVVEADRLSEVRVIEAAVNHPETFQLLSKLSIAQPV